VLELYTLVRLLLVGFVVCSNFISYLNSVSELSRFLGIAAEVPRDVVVIACRMQ